VGLAASCGCLCQDPVARSVGVDRLAVVGFCFFKIKIRGVVKLRITHGHHARADEEDGGGLLFQPLLPLFALLSKSYRNILGTGFQIRVI